MTFKINAHSCLKAVTADANQQALQPATSHFNITLPIGIGHKRIFENQNTEAFLTSKVQAQNCDGLCCSTQENTARGQKSESTCIKALYWIMTGGLP